MKSYKTIPGPKKSPKEHCIAFDKLDGSNIRAEWSKKQGWHKFGTRKQMIDKNHKDFGQAITVFMNSLSEGIVKSVLDCKDYKQVTQITAFSEYHGENSFAGYHDPDDKMRTTLIDVNIYKKGFVLPRTFIRIFEGLDYQRSFTKAFIMILL